MYPLQSSTEPGLYFGGEYDSLTWFLYFGLHNGTGLGIMNLFFPTAEQWNHS